MDIHTSKNRNKIKEIREKRGYTQTDFAKKIGMNRSFLSQVESGQEKVPNKYRERICQELGASEEELYGTSESYVIKDEYLEYSMEIIDSITDASDLSKEERIKILSEVYKMVWNFFENELQKQKNEFEKLKKETRIKEGFFKFLEKKFTNQNGS